LVAARGKWEEAGDELARLAELAPRHPQVRFALAFVALRRGQGQLALRAADDALALRHRFPEARLVRAEALLRIGRPGEARQELVRFLRETPAEMLASERARVERLLELRQGEDTWTTQLRD